MTEPLWRPSAEAVAAADITRFTAFVNRAWNVQATDYPSLHRWSVDHPEQFWEAMWGFAGVIADRAGEVVLEDPRSMPGARWFPQAWLNYAENLLRRRDHGIAIEFRGEDQVRRSLSYAQLYDAVAVLAMALADAGVRRGDRVAGYLPNLPEAIIAMLAAASLGALWSSCSPDFGVNGVLDRFGQIDAEGAVHRRRLPLRRQDRFDSWGGPPGSSEASEHRAGGRRALPRGLAGSDGFSPRGRLWDEFSGRQFQGGETHDAGRYRLRPAAVRPPALHHVLLRHHRVPKCMVHGAGGTLIQHLKEHGAAHRSERAMTASSTSPPAAG